jgi:hypothetical protein
MLANSWSIIVAASADSPSVIPKGSLSARIGGSLYGSGPWLMWMPDHFVAEEEGDVDVWDLVDQVVSRTRSGTRKPKWMKDLGLVETALLQYAAPKTSPALESVSLEAPSRGPGPARRTGADLVRATGIPLSVLEGAALNLARQSSGSRRKRPSK